MPLSLRWVREDDYERVARTRLLCYGGALKDLSSFHEKLLADQRAKPGDFLLAERDGLAVGTTTSLSMTMWVRGGSVPCQGVAYVGTVKTHRRGGSKSERGIASQIMTESLKRARERNEVVSALMPFRASFYEHFGYGFAEQRVEWTVPLTILPSVDFGSIRFAETSDFEAIEQCRQRQCQRGQCDIETSSAAWIARHKQEESGLVIVDRPDPRGPVVGWLYLMDETKDAKRFVRVVEHAADDHPAFVRQLAFLGSLKDQYSAALMTLAGDIQLNRILRETQIPHRPVEHGVAQSRPYTRMQIRVLDHKRWIEAMKLPRDVAGQATIAVRECEGSISKFRIDLDAGRPTVAPSDASADIELSDVQWASISSADITASTAARMNLIQVNNPSALRILDALAIGPAPLCHEYF